LVVQVREAQFEAVLLGQLDQRLGQCYGIRTARNGNQHPFSWTDQTKPSDGTIYFWEEH
jgi:hypothetical protein